jgi:hypothetical protein
LGEDVGDATAKLAWGWFSQCLSSAEAEAWYKVVLEPTATGSKHLKMHNDSDEESDCS